MTSENRPISRNTGPGGWLLESLFFLVVSTSLALLALLDRNLFDTLMWEDNVAEWATFFAFTMGGMVGLAAVFREVRRPACIRRTPSLLILLGLSAFCLFAAGEEISWAQRIFGYRPPDVFQRLNFQQELNLHNILQATGVSPRVVFAAICLGYGALWPILAPYVGRQWPPKWSSVPEFSAPPIRLLPWFVLTGLVYWFSDIDMALEACELLLGLLLLADVLDKADALQLHSLPSRWPVGFKPFAALSTALILGLAANPVIERVFFGADPQLVALARIELTAIGRDLEERHGIEQGIAETGQLADFRLYYGERRGWLHIPEVGYFRMATGAEQATPSGRRQAYLLDPWNNAYWIRFQGWQPAYLYSFGPNRRLDTVLRDDIGVPQPGDVRGDDIGIWIDPFRLRRQ